MPAILPNYEYDIFISYRQNDNKRDGWVSNFVQALKDELEATLKNPVSIYFDENPHDGLLESHQVGASLEKKLKCLVFIPIVSLTYCDTQCFAWEHEFLPFLKMAAVDELGMNITLANGNVASRVLPIKIHDLDVADQQILESELNGPVRSIDFIYKEPGVNRPLSPEDKKEDNLNATNYKNQMNKVANALKDVGTSILRKKQGAGVEVKAAPIASAVAPELANASAKSSKMKLVYTLAAIVIMLLGYWAYSKYNSSSTAEIAGVTSENKIIAVLPFANTKPDPDTDYLGFAIANQIIGELDYNKALTVRPSSAIRKYDQKVFEVKVVADDLKVNYVLTGNYLIVGDVIRLDIELLDASNNKSIWRDKLEVDFSNAFELQDMVAQKVVAGLDVQFSPKELSIIRADISTDPLAYEYYLRSIALPLSVEGSVLAIEMLRKSIALDSTYAPAYAEIGNRANRILVYGSILERPEENPEDYYLRALSLNENQLDALANLAARYTETGRTGEAVAMVRRALELKPNNANARFYLGYIYRYAGMLDHSIKEMEAALVLHPLNPRFRSLGVTYFNAGEDEKAYEAIALDKGSVWELGWQIIIHYRNHEYEKVIELSDKLYQIDGDSQWAIYSHAIVASIQGNFAEGIHWVKQLENLNTNNEGLLIDAEIAYYNASFYAINGDRNGALRCLNKAVNGGYFNYPFMESYNYFDSLTDDKEYQAILTRAKEKHLAFKEQFF